jgi:hypothetical protein
MRGHGWLGRASSWTVFALCLLLLNACKASPLASTAPAKFDLTGRWVLLAYQSDNPPKGRRLNTTPVPPRPENRRQRVQRNRRDQGGLAFVAHDFPVMSAQRMIIEQNQDSMGIDYDRGRYRDLSWGERERGLWKVVTGWTETGDLVSRWRADDAKAQETFQLSADGQRLTVLLDVQTGSDKLNLRRVYSKFN